VPVLHTTYTVVYPLLHYNIDAT